MTNLVIIAQNRLRLTQQTMDSVLRNTKVDDYNCVVVNDGSDKETTEWIERFCEIPNWTALHILKPCGIVGVLRNMGAAFSEKYFGQGEYYVAFLDNDVFVRPNWLPQMIGCLRVVDLVGGYQHPYHGTNKQTPTYDPHWHTFVNEVDAVAGYSLLMRWKNFYRFGPFDANQKGVGASEDWALSQRIIKAGGRVGYVNPPVLLHCGVTNSDGKPATGADQFLREPGVLFA